MTIEGKHKGDKVIPHPHPPWATLLKRKNNARLHLQPPKPQPSHNHNQVDRTCSNKVYLQHKPDLTTLHHWVSPRLQIAWIKSQSSLGKNIVLQACQQTITLSLKPTPLGAMQTDPVAIWRVLWALQTFKFLRLLLPDVSRLILCRVFLLKAIR